MTCGIYSIVNKKTNQMYIGQSINIERRWNEHCKNYNKGKSYIDDAISKYGKNNFILNIIVILPNDKSLLNEMEKYYIWKYNTYHNKKHYNLTLGGETTPSQDPLIAQKISQSQMGTNNSFYGKKHTKESRKKISIAQKNRPHLKGENHPFYNKKRPEHSKKMSGKNNPNYGKIGYWTNKSRPEHSEKIKKYTMWNTHCCHYIKQSMFRCNRKPNPCKCFFLRYKGYDVPIGGFYDFLTVEIINSLFN